MIRAALHTDESEIWWVYLLEGLAAIVFGLLLPMGSLLLIEGAALMSWACHLRESA